MTETNKRHNVSLLITLVANLMLISCGSENDTAKRLGIDGTWETNLDHKMDGSSSPDMKGRVIFNGRRFIYTWYQLRKTAAGKPDAWVPIAKEQGNVVAGSEGLELLAVAYGSFGKEKQPAIMEVSRNDYFIRYEVDGNKLIWMEDYNLDGDYDDQDDFPETTIYTRIAE